MLCLIHFQWGMAYLTRAGFGGAAGPEKFSGSIGSGISTGCIWQFLSYSLLHILSHPFAIVLPFLALIIRGSEPEGNYWASDISQCDCFARNCRRGGTWRYLRDFARSRGR